MEEFKGNSFAAKNEQPRTAKQPVITTNVSVKKESEAHKLKRSFFSEDAPTVGHHIVAQVIIPGVQRLVTDIVKNGIDWLIYGSKGSSKSNGIGNVSYFKYYDRGQPAPSIPASAYKKSSVLDVNNVIFNERGEAEEVLLRMNECVNRYGMVSVADYYDMIGQKCSYTDQKWGWTNLDNAVVMRDSDGYSIRFPKATPIE